MAHLPDELVTEIFLNLDLGATESFFRVSKQFARIANDPTIRVKKYVREIKKIDPLLRRVSDPVADFPPLNGMNFTQDLDLQFEFGEILGDGPWVVYFVHKVKLPEIINGLKASGADVELDDRGNTRLHFAARECDPIRVKDLIEQGLIIDAKNIYGETPLMIASYENCSPVIEALLRAGADPNIVLKGHETPLEFAVKQKQPLIVQLLLTFDADPNLNNPLLSAVVGKNININIVKMLLDAGADPNSQDAGGQTALHNAAYYNHPEAVRLLLDSGADPNIIDDYKNKPLFDAERKGYSEIVAILKPLTIRNRRTQRK